MKKGKLAFRRKGYITIDELRSLGLIPSMERLRKGPVAVAECPEEIPCDICVNSCPLRAIHMDSITDIPRIDWDKCIGCAICVAECPGLAIYVIDLSKDDNRALLTLPYEFNPKPKVDSNAILLSRDGRKLGNGKIVKVWRKNLTWVVTVEVPKELAFEVRAIWIQEK